MFSNFFGNFNNFFDGFEDDFKGMQDSFDKQMQDVPELKPGQKEVVESKDKNGNYVRREYYMSESGSISIRTVSYSSGQSLREDKVDPKQKIKLLESDLERAKAEERYEDCIKIREELKQLKS